jgi:hypothetical protein
MYRERESGGHSSSASRCEAVVRLCLRALHGEFDMFTKRRIERHQLPYFLEVFNSVTDKPIGYLGNVCADGLMLISDLPMMIGADFDLRLKVPAGKDHTQDICLKACCLWCHEDATPLHYDAGFSLRRPPPEYGQLIEALKQYFSFQPLPASV